MLVSAVRCLRVLVVVSVTIINSQPANAEPTVVTAHYGKLASGEDVLEFTMRNSHGMQVKVIEYGATISELSTADRSGKFASVVLGAKSLDDYVKGFPAASVIGRYANRIRGASFNLEGQTISLPKNSGENHIHGGRKNFAKAVWKGLAAAGQGRCTVILRLTSPDGDEGFPGKLEVVTTYVLTDNNELAINYQARTDKATIVNLTNHAYFNLSGSLGDVLDHQLQIVADKYTVVDKSLIPTGEIASLNDSPLDFRQPRRVGQRIAELYDAARGYDHNYVLWQESPPTEPRLAAKVVDPKSGRVMECFTTEPGVQLYTANGFNNNPFPKHGALCLETQHFPDSPNHPEFPSTVLKPDQAWNSTTVFRFSIQP